MEFSKKHRIRLWVLLVLTFAALGTVKGNRTEAAEEEALSFSNTAVILYLGEGGVSEQQLVVNGLQDGMQTKWSSKDTSVVEVDETGWITATGAGKTVVVCEIADKDKTVTTLKASVRVRDNITELALGFASAAQRKNVLYCGVDYTLAYTCKTVAGTNQNTSNVIYYEALSSKGQSTEKAAVSEDGVFRAKNCGTYRIKAYAFQTAASRDKWLSDRSKYAKYVLAEDGMTVTVVMKNFRTVSREAYGFCMELPESYLFRSEKEEDGTINIAVNAYNAQKQIAASNIQVTLEPCVEEAADIDRLASTMKEVYTKKFLAASWKKVYGAQKATVTKLSVKLLTINGKKLVRLNYSVALDDIFIEMQEAADVKIDRMEFYNTIYSWYDGEHHITVTVNDALESIQPNISGVAEKLAGTLTEMK